MLRACIDKTFAWFIGTLQISIAVLILQAQAFADTPAPPRDYKQVSTNDKFLFVMLAPDSGGEHDANLRTLYKQSGLYRNAQSRTPLWTINWYAHKVFVHSGGVHLIRMGPWASSAQELALAFYKEGRETKAYRISDLICDASKLQHTVSHFFWISELRYDDRHAFLFLKTVDNQTYKFSAKTGEIVWRATTVK